MLRNAEYIYDNIIIADEIHTTKAFCKKAQVGVDLSLRNVYNIVTPGHISKDKSKVSEYSPIPPSEEGWFLPQGSYIAELNEGVRIPETESCIIIQRSSLNRSGCTIISSLWDNGYTSQNGEVINSITVRLNVDTPMGVYIDKDTRVAQIIAMTTEEAALYNGQFQGGLHQSNKL